MIMIIIMIIIIIINPTKLTEKLGHPRVFIIIVHGSNVAGPLASTGSSIFSFTKSMEEPWREGILTGAGVNNPKLSLLGQKTRENRNGYPGYPCTSFHNSPHPFNWEPQTKPHKPRPPETRSPETRPSLDIYHQPPHSRSLLDHRDSS